MLGSTRSLFGEQDDYQAALQHDGGFDLVVTGQGEFRAELIRSELPRTLLVAGVEQIARVAFVTLPRRMVRIALPTRGGGSLRWNGIALQPNELAMQGPNQSVHETTVAACRWRTIWLPVLDLRKYGCAVTGRNFDVPLGVYRWQPDRAALRHLNRLYDDATRMTKTQPRVFAAAEASRGLEQELIAMLIDCMQMEPAAEATAASKRHANIMERFEILVQNRPKHTYSIEEICADLRVPTRTFRALCISYLGVGPHRYLLLRKLQGVRRVLRKGGSEVSRIGDIAQQHGFGGLGRFAASYRQQFGELPSETLRRRTLRYIGNA
jgi:AraC-like DNA-binding protein